MSAAVRYAIAELATLGGVSRRTVRYYVQERLIPQPLGLGRGNHYTAEHLEQLLRVKAMQENGRTLDDIRRALGQKPQVRAAQKPAHEESPPRSLWRRVAVTPGVELHVASTVRLPSPARLRELAEWCRVHFADASDTNEKDENHHG
jgi:DNA-binding transcriptional MerR regulator